MNQTATVKASDASFPLFITGPQEQVYKPMGINIRLLIQILYAVTIILTLLSLPCDYMALHYPNEGLVKKYTDFFYLNNENNLPTLFSVLLLLAASLLCFFIAAIDQPVVIKPMKTKVYWLLLGVAFTFLGLDEGLQIHDMISHVDAVETVSKESSFLYFGWVIPYTIGTVITGLFFLRFLFALPVPVRNRIIIAGVIYVSGALGFEFIESYVHTHSSGENSILGLALCDVEEVMEMVGAILFIHVLLDYIKMSKAEFKFV